jgi:hypothetical protein
VRDWFLVGKLAPIALYQLFSRKEKLALRVLFFFQKRSGRTASLNYSRPYVSQVFLFRSSSIGKKTRTRDPTVCFRFSTTSVHYTGPCCYLIKKIPYLTLQSY